MAMTRRGFLLGCTAAAVIPLVKPVMDLVASEPFFSAYSVHDSLCFEFGSGLLWCATPYYPMPPKTHEAFYTDVKLLVEQRMPNWLALEEGM